eukprot:CAMPEP_0167783644 /NCGR_PEP_ID=MMETSP0111_2-20121227/7183_1 /TAXON_ID=91324 /ORGANISM="Lotharella globosa, Strain CCCM811" /LENGTH=125 /DNA_ID=CAMNT_0007674601 /DNA_START=911 /DNA_END=1289 /DNA_ORIENTATION=+
MPREVDLLPPPTDRPPLAARREVGLDLQQHVHLRVCALLTKHRRARADRMELLDEHAVKYRDPPHTFRPPADVPRVAQRAVLEGMGFGGEGGGSGKFSLDELRRYRSPKSGVLLATTPHASVTET